MERIREGRRAALAMSGGAPPPRRRLRSNGGGVSGGAGPRGSPRSERRRGERLMLNGNGRDDGDDTSDDSLGDDDDDADEELAASAPRFPPVQRRSPSTAPPPSPPQPGAAHHHSSSSSGGGYNNHHHHGQQQMHRRGGSNPKGPIVWKAADEMIGVPVPRKARSASTKRSSHEWTGPGGGSGGAVAVDGSQIQRPSSRPISPASTSATAPVRKKLKTLGGGGSSGGSGPVPKQRPSPASAPPAAPPQPPPAKISKSPSFIQEEIEVAEVLFGLTRQFPCPPKQENTNHKPEPKDAPEAKSGNSSPAPSSSGVRPADSASLTTTAPKRKRPRLVKYDNENLPASPAKPDTAEPPSRPEVPPVARSDAKPSVLAVAESGASSTAAATAGAQQESTREPEKREDHRGRDPELRASESDRRDPGPESSRAEPPAAAVKPDGEAAAPVGSEARNGEATTATKSELASDGARQEKFCIDLMAPPPGKLSPDRDGSSDPDADKKGLDSEMDVDVRGNSEKKDGERTRRGLEINLEDEKAQRIPAEEHAPKKLTLQLDLEKPSQGDEKSPYERRQPPLPPQQQQQQHKPSKSEVKHEKSPLPAASPPMPMTVGGWMGTFPPFSYIAPVPGLSAPGLHHPMDIKPGTSAGLQHPALPPLPVRPKRCATHCYIAQQIQYHQRITKMNSFWPTTAAAAAAAAAAATRSAPFFGPRGPFNMGVVPPAEAASLLANPMQGSYPVRAHAPLQETKAPSMVPSPFQGSLSKDKASSSSASVAESNQRKQPPALEAQQSSPMPPNMMQAPTFIFPFNQHAAAVAAATAAANRMGDTKSSGTSSAMPSSAAAHASAAHPGAPCSCWRSSIISRHGTTRRRCTVFQRACLLSPHVEPITAARYAATKSSEKPNAKLVWFLSEAS
uniref:Protein TIME FOR COFFEE n=1 Tax=Aegilops tauschii subsp. strangulata TaxID=200361 RepID=A0A453B8M5_AEGTS